MPGSKPPSATPSKALTPTNDPKPLRKPRQSVRAPQTLVRRGSQIFGESFLRTRLLGSSLLCVSLISAGILLT